MFDSVYTLAAALTEFGDSHSILIQNLSCDAEESWSDGPNLYKFINSVSIFHAPFIHPIGRNSFMFCNKFSFVWLDLGDYEWIDWES